MLVVRSNGSPMRAMTKSLRVVAGEAPIAANSWGGGAHLWTPTDLPSTIDNAAMSNILSRFVNYKAAYAKLWGQS